jgi:ABC-2 type transport system ATP-binding protein
MLEVKNITKLYGQKKTLDSMSFSIKKGEAAGLVGPNGAGKSTTMNIITGYLAANSGSVTLDGARLADAPSEYKKKIGYLPEIPPLYTDMTVREYLAFACEIKGVAQNARQAAPEVARAAQKARVDDVLDRLINNLSKGYRQRVGLAQAILGAPGLLVLDEPTIGLDPNQIIEVRGLLSELKKDHAILLSSHILSEITEVCDRIILINEGKLLALGTPEELAARLGRQVCRFRTAGDPEKITELVLAQKGVLSCERAREREKDKLDYAVACEPGFELRDTLAKEIIGAGYPLFLLEYGDSLESLFTLLTSKGGGAA